MRYVLTLYSKKIIINTVHTPHTYIHIQTRNNHVWIHLSTHTHHCINPFTHSVILTIYTTHQKIYVLFYTWFDIMCSVDIMSHTHIHRHTHTHYVYYMYIIWIICLLVVYLHLRVLSNMIKKNNSFLFFRNEKLSTIWRSLHCICRMMMMMMMLKIIQVTMYLFWDLKWMWKVLHIF